MFPSLERPASGKIEGRRKIRIPVDFVESKRAKMDSGRVRASVSAFRRKFALSIPWKRRKKNCGGCLSAETTRLQRRYWRSAQSFLHFRRRNLQKSFFAQEKKLGARDSTFRLRASPGSATWTAVFRGTLLRR